MPSAVFSTLISSGSVKESSPLAPYIFTVWPLTVAVTAAGTGTGFFPMRDMVVVLALPAGAGAYP